MGRRSAAAIGSVFAILAATGCSFGPSGPADEAVWQASLAKDGAGMLDGKSFDVTVTETGKSDGEDETIEFHGGRFHSAECDEYGFTSGAYVAAKTGAAISFHAETTSEKEGRIQWRGSVQDDAIEGSFVWTKPGQKPIEYAYKGAKH